jgi:hypothetical protein
VFAAKLPIVVEEADEALYWLELVRETGLVKADRQLCGSRSSPS